MEGMVFIDRKIMDGKLRKKISINTPYYKGELLIEEVWLVYRGLKLKFNNKQVKSLIMEEISEFKKNYLLEMESGRKSKKILLEECGSEISKNVKKNIGIIMLFREFFINERMWLRHVDDCNGVEGKSLGRCCLVHKEIYETRLKLMLKATEMESDSKHELLSSGWWKDHGIDYIN